MLRVLSLVLLAAGVRAGQEAGAAVSREQALEDSWSKELDGNAKKTPIQRVVSLLTEMKAQLEAEASKESEMYDKMVCWCETNEKEKTKAIADAEVKNTDLETEIGSRAANHGKLSAEIKAMKKQIAADQESLDKATAIREKEAATFRDEEKEMIQAITNLKNAIAVLAKHQGQGGASMMQLEPAVRSSVRAVLHDVSMKYDLLLGDKPKLRKAGREGAALLAVDASQSTGLHSEALLKELGEASDALPLNIAEHMLSKSAGQTQEAFVQAPGYKSYASQSGTIFGVLTRMKDEFEADLSQKQKDEMKAAADYKEMAEAKTSQIETAKEKLDALEGEHAENQKLLADAKEDLDATRKQRAADVEFLRNLRVACQGLDTEWEQRSKTRSEEILAVSEALKMLTEDDARELMAKTVMLLQTVTETEAKKRQMAAAASLRKASREPGFEADDLLADWNTRATGGSHSPKTQLATLALSAQLDSFTEVKEAMDKMIADLKAQQEQEVASKAYCQKELNDNEKMTFQKETEKKDLEAELESLASTISRLETEIGTAKDQIAETKVAIKKASEAREKENTEFQSVVTDQRATQEILSKVLARLQAFYKKKASLLQRSAKTVQTPPVQFNKYKKNAGSNSVLGMIEQIIEDSKKLEAEAMDGEAQAQKEYEEFVKDSNSVIASQEEAVTSKTNAVAAAKESTAEATSNHQSTEAEIESLAQYNADLHKECDFLLKNFDIRQQARLQEIEAIQNAKAILSGAASA